MRVKTVYFTDDQEPLRDVVAVVAGRFLLVTQDENDTDGTLYNLDIIRSIEGVEPIKRHGASRIGVASL
jgi:hypothetical protein